MNDQPQTFIIFSGNTVILAIFNNEHKNIHGAWCDSYSSNNQKIPFICEAKI